MIIHPTASATADLSVHRALWALLPARAQRALGFLRPLAATEAPAPASGRVWVAAGLFLLGLAVAQQWVFFGSLLAALVGLAPCRRVLAASAACIGAAQQKVKQDKFNEDARAARVEAASAAALAAGVVRLAVVMMIIITIMAALSCAIAAISKSKCKSIDINLTQRNFGQQLAGAATQ